MGYRNVLLFWLSRHIREEVKASKFKLLFSPVKILLYMRSNSADISKKLRWPFALLHCGLVRMVYELYEMEIWLRIV